MAALVSIGDFSKMTHLSVKALRHYHDVGLLEPAAVDRWTGYRSYATDQVAIAQVIRRFRDMGMPLDQVRAVISAPDVETRNREIVAHLKRMERELAETQSTVTGLRALLEGAPPHAPVEFRSIPAAGALAISEVVTVEEFSRWWISVFQELGAAVHAAGLSPTGLSGALYPGDIFEQERGEVTAFIPVASPPPATGRTEHLEVPGTEVAIMVHRGAFEDADITYGALGTVVAERAIGLDGPIREYYVRSPLDTAEVAHYRTEVCWPVFRTAPAGRATPAPPGPPWGIPATDP